MIVLLALNCKSTDNQDNLKNEDIVLISKGNLHGSGSEGIEKQSRIIETESEWNDLVSKMNSVNKVSNSFSETDINFSIHSVITVFDEVKSTGGHSLELDIQNTSDKIIIEVIRKAPEGMATAVITQPYYLAKIPKINKTIEFK